ncbi:MAG TPA: uroporphyrinogen decarboxylase family protein [Candidatus Hydrogenedentes bacterium]|nr:uroporphyrinogen decarboxylase family protein [Candidatus Hydrogenedentota bacterium]
MPMSSYEVVRRAIEFDQPDRLPVRFDWLGITDVRSVPWNQIGTGNIAEKHSVDEWGCGWERSDMPNMGQVKGHPLADWLALETFTFPDPETPAFYKNMEQFFEVEEDTYRCTGIFMLLFERMHALRGFENTLLDLYAERERIGWLADKVVDFDLGIIRNIHRRFGNKIHGFGFTDDWGTERDLFISPDLWVEFFQPRYKRIFDACHANGWHVWMHSCGKVNDIIEPLIEIGLDVINLQQPRALGIEEIGERYRGRICFESLCDIQHTLPFKGEAEIREEARLLLEHWATPVGGFILSDYGDSSAIGVQFGAKETMLKAFRDADPWRSAAV